MSLLIDKDLQPTGLAQFLTCFVSEPYLNMPEDAIKLLLYLF